MFEHCTIFIVPLVFPAVVVGHLPEEFIGQSSSCLSQTSLQILTIKTDHVKVLNAGETHDLAGQIPVSVNVLKRNTKSLQLFFIIYIKFVHEIKCTSVFQEVKEKHMKCTICYYIGKSSLTF